MTGPRLPAQSSGCLRDRQDHERSLRAEAPSSVTLALVDRMIARLECELSEAEDWMLGSDPGQARKRMREDLAAWRAERRRIVRLGEMR